MQLNLIDNFKEPSVATPFRYTGGKRVIAKEVSMLMPSDTKSMLSPFLGGGGLELRIAARGVRVYAYDLSEFITAFWIGFLSNPHQVCKDAFQFYSDLNDIDDLTIVKDKINFLSKGRNVLKIADIHERAGIIWAINSMVRDGRPGGHFCNNRTENGPNNGKYWGMRKPEFFINQRFIDWWNPNITVEREDWRVSMKKHPDIFMYADPPYIGKDRMYDDANEKFKHQAFAREVKSRNSPWILSYGKHDMIYDLYSEYKILEPKWTKKALAPQNPREEKVDGDELLILNL